MPTVILSLVLLLVGCASSPPVVLDPFLIQPFTYAAGKREPRSAPYVSRYAKGGREIIFLAARHDVGTDNPTVRTLDEVLKTYRPRLIIVEGRPFTSISNPIDLTSSENCAKIQFKDCGENRYAVFRAHQSGIAFTYAEPNPFEIRDEVRRQGYTDSDLVFFYALRQIPQWKREGIRDRPALTQKTGDSLKRFAVEIGTSENYSLFDFQRWYREHFKMPFDPASVDNETVSPQIDQHPTLANRLAHIVGEVRERSLVRRMEAGVNEFQKILVVYGEGHLVKQRALLEHALGSPQEMKFF